MGQLKSEPELSDFFSISGRIKYRRLTHQDPGIRNLCNRKQFRSFAYRKRLDILHSLGSGKNPYGNQESRDHFIFVGHIPSPLTCLILPFLALRFNSR